LVGTKRPRRQAAIGKNYAEADEDPYIYTSGVVLRGNQRRRKADEEVSRLDSISPTHSAQRSFISKEKLNEIGAFNFTFAERKTDQ
jgi:hypothetical protein